MKYFSQKVLLVFILLFSMCSWAGDKLSQKEIDRFAQVLSTIKHYYIKETSYSDLFNDATKGMLEGLDPHSSYYAEEALKLSNKHKWNIWRLRC